ncbi:MAG TPA: DUF1015 domain-containing protein [Myxococcota bacterium]|nr:DUF1015 domain-containing protein [Myxococcota bacterium]
MTEVRPFRALRYDSARVDLSRVIVPPYDVVSAEDRAAFYDRDPHNAIRLELTRDVADEATTDYAQVPETLAAWTAERVLTRDAEPALYPLRQSFRAPDGSRLAREGFFALVHLEDYAQRIVRPHERTLAGPKADRLKLLQAARANLSVVFLLYEDREHALAPLLRGALERRALGAARDESGAEHRLARLADPAAIAEIARFLANRPVVIADGHHRYETALAYRDERRAAGFGSGRDAPHEWLLVYLANAFAPGSLLLPIHRLVLKGALPTEPQVSRSEAKLSEGHQDCLGERLTGWESRAVPIADPEQLPELLAHHLEPLRDRHAFAADDASGRLRIFSRPRRGDELTVRVIHREVIEGVFGLDESAVRAGAIAYPKSALQTARDLRAGRGAVALYLNPLSAEDVFRVTGAGEVLPQKSTFFTPKLPSGLVFRPLDGA